MIELYQFHPYWGLLNTSPFCMKLQVYLQLAKIPYRIHNTNNPRRSPSHKLPFIKDEGKTITDSSVIIDYLKTTHEDTLDRDLSPVQKATALATQRLVEEHLYFIIVYSRWVDDIGWEKVKADFFQDLPKILQIIVPKVLRKRVKNDLWRQGIGRLSRDQIYQAGIADLTAVAELLGNKQFFLRDTVSSIDACVYSFLASILYAPVESPIKAYIKGNAALTAYCERVKQMLVAPSMVDAL